MSGVYFLALLVLGATLIHSSRAIRCYDCTFGTHGADCEDPYSGLERHERECSKVDYICYKAKGEVTRKDSETFLPDTVSSWSKRYYTTLWRLV